MLIVPKKLLITVEGRGTPYTNMKNYCVDKRANSAIFEVEVWG